MKTEKYLLRLDTEVMAWLKDEAHKNHRTPAGQLRLVIEDFMKNNADKGD